MTKRKDPLEIERNKLRKPKILTGYMLRDKFGTYTWDSFAHSKKTCEQGYLLRVADKTLTAIPVTVSIRERGFQD